MQRGLKQTLGGVNVLACVFGKARPPALPHTRLGRQMEDDVSGSERLVEVQFIQVTGQELEGRMAARLGDVGALDGGSVVGREGIDAHYAIAGLEQGFRQVRTDETGHPCYDGPVLVAPRRL